MPTYEYECESCNKTFERFQSITAKPVRRCPACGMRKVRRLISRGAGFLFRGSGFYQTDYRSEEYKAKAKAESGASASSSSSGTASKEAGSKESASKHGAKSGK